MSRKRLSKKQLKSDKFVQHTFDWAHWAETHRSQVLVALAGIAVLVAAFFVYRGLARAGEEDAARSYIEARQAYFAGNYQLAVSDLQAFLDQHEDSSYGDDARIFLADAYYQAGDPQAAVETLQWFHRHEDSPFAINALLLEAAAYQGIGSLDPAAEAYQEALERTEVDAQRVEILGNLADVYELKGDTDQAAVQLQAIVDLDPEAPAADLARRKLAELTVRPLSAVGSGPEGAVAPSDPMGAAAPDSTEGEG
ncbi:MAG: tetratricopeptide repeat protein [Gemmatimonadota bacterium]